ncbi:WD repeat and SOCS box-containing protein 1-like [Tubulanus polymorphus]|uniref:WD repeat and SOCS box-containing protein 1-like n=1 Tax=Tubulanus polymorphus TaxID=672921 RepID=UPI003DA2383A
MASFYNANASDIDPAELITELLLTNNPFAQKAGGETWSTAWAPDSSCFAWSCGNRIVKIIPWNRVRNEVNLNDPSDENDYEQENDHFAIRGYTTNREGIGFGRHVKRHAVTIDAGELIWSVAFGSSSAETQPHSVNLSMRHYNHAADLLLATGLNSGRIRVWEVSSGRLMFELLDHKDVVRDLKFSPDGLLQLVSASRDGTVKVWDIVDDGNMKKTLRGNAKWVYSCVWSPDAKRLACVGNQKSVIVWDMKTYKCIHKLEGHYHDVVSCDFSPDGALLVTASYDTRVLIWDAHTGEKIQELRHLFPPPTFIFAGGANDTYVRSVSFSHDGMHVASVADDRYVRFWRILDGEGPPEQITVVPDALCCSYSPDGTVLAVGTRNGAVSFWAAPMEVESLQHLCRMAVRRILPTPSVDHIHLPMRLKEFLKYHL